MNKLREPSNEVKSRILSGNYTVHIRAQAVVSIGRKTKSLQLSHVRWFLHHGQWPISMIDHIDGNTLNNDISNLRYATPSQNQANRKISKNNSSGKNGVSFRKDLGKYSARIRVDGRNVNLGYFASVEEASTAYKEAAKSYFGEFARVTD